MNLVKCPLTKDVQILYNEGFSELKLKVQSRILAIHWFCAINGYLWIMPKNTTFYTLTTIFLKL